MGGSGGTGPTATCGDGEMNRPTEGCDDGNTDDGDGCDADCQLEPFCGDGEVNQPSEGCDDGNNDDGDGCDADCQFEPFCGDGEVNQPSEGCDDGNNDDGDGCDADCQLEPFCGDGILQSEEVCDTTVPAEYTCQTEGYDAGTIACTSTCDALDTNGCRNFVCGDNLQEGPEACDDGNTDDGDGCSATCALEGDGCAAPIDLSLAPTANPNEWSVEVDTTNFNDDFDAACGTTNQPDAIFGFTASAAGDYLFVVDAGFDAILWAVDDACGGQPSELACIDLSSSTVDDGLSLVLAQNETAHIILGGHDSTGGGVPNAGPFTLTASLAVCGDGIVGPGEACDDGNTEDGDGCSTTCQFDGPIPEVEPNNAHAAANTLPIGHVGTGVVDWLAGDLADYWAVELDAGATYVFRTASAADGSCGTLDSDDSALELYDSQNAILASNADIDPATNRCAELTYTPSTTTTYYLMVSQDFTSGTLPNVPVAYFVFADRQ